MLTKRPTNLRVTGAPSILEDKNFCRLLVLGTTLVVAVLGFVGFNPRVIPTMNAASKIVQRPLTGYCSNPSIHCYAERDWYGHTGGTYTRIQPFGGMSCSGCVGFIDNETWFSDPTVPNAQARTMAHAG
jgi:hypothetical protein